MIKWLRGLVNHGGSTESPSAKASEKKKVKTEDPHGPAMRAQLPHTPPGQQLVSQESDKLLTLGESIVKGTDIQESDVRSICHRTLLSTSEFYFTQIYDANEGLPSTSSYTQPTSQQISDTITTPSATQLVAVPSDTHLTRKLPNTHYRPSSSSQLTPTSSKQLTPTSSSQLTPTSSSQLTPTSSSQLTPTSSSQLTPTPPPNLTPTKPSSLLTKLAPETTLNESVTNSGQENYDLKTDIKENRLETGSGLMNGQVNDLSLFETAPKSANADVEDPNICTNPYPCCYHSTCVYCYSGQLCTVLGERYILSRLEGVLVLVFIVLKTSSDQTSFCRVLWKGDTNPIPLSQVPDGTRVHFDAITSPSNECLQAVVIWQDKKPTICVEPDDDQTFMIIDGRGFVCETDFVDTVKRSIRVRFDGDLVDAEVCKDVLFMNGEKSEMTQLCNNDLHVVYATVFKLLNGDMGGSVSYVCTCLWTGQRPPINKLPMNFQRRKSYVKKSHGFYVEANSKFTLYCDIVSTLSISKDICKLSVKIDDSKMLLQCTREQIYTNIKCKVILNSKEILKAHILKRENKNGIISWAVVMLNLSLPSSTVVSSCVQTEAQAKEQVAGEEINGHPRNSKRQGKENMEINFTETNDFLLDNSTKIKPKTSTSSLTSQERPQTSSTTSLTSQERPQTSSTSSLTSQERPQTSSTSSLTSQVRPQTSSTTSLTSQVRPQTSSTSSLTSQVRPQTSSTSSLTSQVRPQTSSTSSLTRPNTIKPNLVYLTCAVVKTHSDMIIVRALGNFILVFKRDLFINKEKVGKAISLTTELKKFKCLGVIFYKNQKPIEVWGHKVRHIAVIAWAGKKPDTADDIVEAWKPQPIKMWQPEYDFSYSKVPGENTPVKHEIFEASCNIVSVSRGTGRVVVRSKHIEGGTGEAVVSLSNMYLDRQPVTKTQLETYPSSLAWNCLFGHSSLKTKDGKSRYVVTLAWRGGKPNSYSSSSLKDEETSLLHSRSINNISSQVWTRTSSNKGDVRPQTSNTSTPANKVWPQTSSTSNLTSQVRPQTSSTSSLTSQVRPQTSSTSSLTSQVRPQTSSLASQVRLQTSSTSSHTSQVRPLTRSTSSLSSQVRPQTSSTSSLSSQVRPQTSSDINNVSVQKALEYMTCIMIEAQACMAILRATEKLILVFREDCFIHNEQLDDSANLKDALQRLDAFGALVYEAKHPMEIWGHTVKYISVMAWFGKKPTAAGEIVKTWNLQPGALEHHKYKSLLSKMRKNMPVKYETHQASCTIVNVTRSTGTVVVRSKYVEGGTGAAVVSLSNMYQDGLPVSKKKLKSSPSGQIWHCLFQQNSSHKANSGQPKFVVTLAWQGKKPISSSSPSKVGETRLCHSSSTSSLTSQVRPQTSSTSSLTSQVRPQTSSTSSLTSQERPQTSSNSSLTNECEEQPRRKNRKRNENKTSVEATNVGTEVTKDRQPRSAAKGRITDLHSFHGQLQINNGSTLYFSRDHCYLYGLRLHQVELWYILTLGMEAEYELSADAAGPQRLLGVWVEGKEHPPPATLGSLLTSWCLQNSVPHTASQILLTEAESLSPNLFPTSGDDGDMETVNIGQDCS